MEQLGIGTNVAGNQYSQWLSGWTPAVEFDLDGRGAEEMARIPVTSANAAHDLEPCLVFDRSECVERRNGIGLGVDWFYLRPTARRIASVERGNLQFLNASGIGQEIGAQVDRAARGPDRSAESVRSTSFGSKPLWSI